MFNTTIFKSPEVIRIHEHRAPTDDSIRLADEMRQKALDSITHDYRFENNVVNGRVHVIQDRQAMQKVIVISGQINGVNFEVRSRVDAVEIRMSRAEAFAVLVREVADRIALQFLKEASDEKA